MIFFFFFSYFLLSFATSQEIFKFSWWIFLSVFEMIEIDWHERDEKIRKKKKKECFDARVRKFTLIHLCVNFLIIYNIRSDHELFLLVYYTWFMIVTYKFLLFIIFIWYSLPCWSCNSFLLYLGWLGDSCYNNKRIKVKIKGINSLNSPCVSHQGVVNYANW